MTMHCLKCFEVWDHEDYCCPACDCATVDSHSDMKPTLQYEFYGNKGQKISPYKNNPSFEYQGQKVNFTYDVIRISTGKSIYD